MLWLFITLAAYVLLAIVAVGDKFFVSNQKLRPSAYVFYIGALGLPVFLLIPFVGFQFPVPLRALLGVGAGISFGIALFWMFRALKLFEASVVIPMIGGFIPLFTLGLTFLFSKEHAEFTAMHAAAFILLVGGSALMSWETSAKHTAQSLFLAVCSALWFSFSFAVSKYAYIDEHFWSVFMARAFGVFLAGLFLFLFSRGEKKEIAGASQPPNTQKSASYSKRFFLPALFVANQGIGAVGQTLQNYAIFLVPVSMVAFVNALEGVRFAFLLLFTSLLSLFFPHIIRERITRNVLMRKIIAIFIIGAGLILLARIIS
ncbi:MAG: hypothetical protein HYV78_02260 [Candidatus Wildermuthbacteria bacterium]|nr:hypothetical protein [Candidatus Wildermuthbacteria bacterium]